MALSIDDVKPDQGRLQTIAVAATFTAEPIEPALSFWMKELNLTAKVEFAPYNQVFQELLKPDSRFNCNDAGMNVILVRLEDWAHAHTEDGVSPPGPRDAYRSIESNASDLASALKSVAGRLPVPCLLCFCPSNLSGLDIRRFARETEQRLSAELANLNGVEVVTSSQFEDAYPDVAGDDPFRNRIGHIPYTEEFYVALGTLVARRFYGLGISPYKVIVLDCDQTLWKGVCGEDGPLRIEIDDARKALQRSVVKLHDAGMLVCLCSQNNEKDVLEVFQCRPELPLKRDHIVSWRINWRAKSENIQSLARELGLGLDSFVFVDDDPVTCAEVRANCPAVLTLQLPKEPAAVARFLDQVWVLDRLAATEEDGKRTQLYKLNATRERLRDDSSSFTDFLAKLDLRIEISTLSPQEVARVAQLTQRTNQFNFTTTRRSEHDIRSLLASDRHECFVVHVRDRFGDYGLVGVVICGCQANCLVVDTLLLSCRALGRGVEHRMLAFLGELAEGRGLARLEICLVPTDKNRPALDFITSVAPQYSQENGGRVLSFKLPAEFASRVVYPPKQLASPPEVLDDPVEDHPGPRPRAWTNAPSTLWTRIASELYTPQRIANAIAASKHTAREGTKTAYVAPRTPLERELAHLWTEILGVDSVGVDDNFFELGGHSLLVTQVMSRIHNAYRVELTFQDFFEGPTVAGLAIAVTSGRLQREDPNRRSQMIQVLHPRSEGPIDRRRAGPTAASGTDRTIRPGSISTIGFITFERLEALRTSITSYIENTRKHRRDVDFVVIDGSMNDRVRTDCRVALGDLRERYGVSIFYGGLEEKIRYADRLAKASGVPPEIIDFALFDTEHCGKAVGADRNALLLHTVGDLMFSADDDTLCRIAAAPEMTDGLGLGSFSDPADYWFFPDRDAALRSVRYSEPDLLGLHESLLGRDLAAIVTESKNGGSIDPGLLSRVQTGGGRVVLTFNGVVGDCAWGSPFGFWGAPMGSLMVNEGSHARLVSSEAAYREACASREIWRSVKRTTITDPIYCMTLLMGMDNRDLLPPFMPVRRGQDMVFGTTLAHCCHEGLAAHLPWALVHIPVEKRRFWDGEIGRSASGYDTARLLIDCITSKELGPPRNGCGGQMRTLGQHLVELGKLSLSEFEVFVHGQIRRTVESNLALMEGLLRGRPAAPDFWTKDMRRYIDMLKSSVKRDDYAIPLDLMQDRNSEQARALAQTLVLRFGQLLLRWEDIVQAAKKLKAQGISLAEPI